MSANGSQNQNVGLEARHVQRAINNVEILKDISFRVNPGEIFVIMGPSGSGKTVLLKHLIGLEAPDAGEILVQGESIQTPGIRDKYRMAMVFQSGALLGSLTVGENVGLYWTEEGSKTQEEIDAIVAEKLAAVGLKGMEARYPNELSGGMIKRVAIARALVIEPQLIMLDEPTSELDPLMSITVGEEILSLKTKHHSTCIVVTHDRDLAFGISDRMAMISDGKILFVGTADEVKQSSDPQIQKFIYAELPARRYSK